MQGLEEYQVSKENEKVSEKQVEGIHLFEKSSFSKIRTIIKGTSIFMTDFNFRNKNLTDFPTDFLQIEKDFWFD